MVTSCNHRDVRRLIAMDGVHDTPVHALITSEMPSPHDRLIRKLDSIANLSPEDRDAIRSLPISVRTLEANQDVVRAGDRPACSCLLIEGFMRRYKDLADGSRQTLSYHLPGDIPDLMSLHLGVMDHSLATVVPSKAAFIAHADLSDLLVGSPSVSLVLWREALIDAAIFRAWIVNVGARAAKPRLAHLICELFVRMSAVGLAQGDGFILPLTQNELAFATGMTPVHVSRTLNELRAAGLIGTAEGRFLRIRDWAGLQRIGDFDATYLHLKIGAGLKTVHPAAAT